MKTIKKFFAIVIAIALGIALGYAIPKVYIHYNRTFEYQRGIGKTEVLADYDDKDKDGKVYYRVKLWDEEFKYGKIVREGYAQKEDLAGLCEEAHIAEPYMSDNLQARF